MTTAKKIVVIGPESTGKSTLSAALAEELHTVWVPEYARSYLQQLGRPYTEQDLTEIAKGQVAAEDALLPQANKYLVCDTDLYIIKVWSQHAYGRCDKWILNEIAKRKYDLYLLTGIDMPWVADPLREHPTDEMRVYFYNWYKEIVMNSGVAFVMVNGGEEERLRMAVEAVRALNPRSIF